VSVKFSPRIIGYCYNFSQQPGWKICRRMLLEHYFLQFSNGSMFCILFFEAVKESGANDRNDVQRIRAFSAVLVQMLSQL